MKQVRSNSKVDAQYLNTDVHSMLTGGCCRVSQLLGFLFVGSLPDDLLVHIPLFFITLIKPLLPLLSLSIQL